MRSRKFLPPAINIGRASARRPPLAGAFAALLLMASLSACQGPPRVVISNSSGVREAVVEVEIARTSAAQQTGLMYRAHLAQNRGMLFVFKHPQHLTFWMKNTEIPLDMVFADADHTIIGIVANAEPFSERLLSVSGESQYVLEVNGGYAARHHIRAGDRLRFVAFRKTEWDVAR